jgi:hypothetical protein
MHAPLHCLFALAGLMPASNAAEVPRQGHSLAIFALQPKNGVGADVAELVLEQLVDKVRHAGVFDTVVSAKELESVIAFERQRQLVDCTGESCLAEIAGAFNVEMVLAGSVGKAGNSWILSLKLINARTSRTVGAVSRRITRPGEDALLDSIQPALDELLADAGLKAAPVTPVVRESSTPRWRWPVVGAGAAAAAVGVPLVMLACVSVATAGTLVAGTWDLSPLPTGNLPVLPLGFLPRVAAAVAGAAAAGVLLLAAVVAGVAGGGMIAAGFLAGGGA